LIVHYEGLKFKPQFTAKNPNLGEKIRKGFNYFRNFV